MIIINNPEWARMISTKSLNSKEQEQIAYKIEQFLKTLNIVCSSEVTD